MHTPQDEKDDPVWDLLEKSPPAKPGAFFSRNVTREVRKLESARQDSPFFEWLGWLKRPVVWQASLAAVAIGAITAGMVIFSSGDRTSTNSGGPIVEATVPEPTVLSQPDEAVSVSEPEYDPAHEIENLTYLGELMAVADPAMLDDDALADLLF